MKKNLLVLLFMFLALFLTGCNSNKAMLRKMSISDLPKITEVESVKKKNNFVSQTTWYIGEKATFENYVMNVYDYLKENYYETLGYTTELLDTFFGMGGKYDFYNETNALNQFKIETEDRIVYQYIFSNKNTFWLDENDGTYYVEGASSIIAVYFKDFQYEDNNDNDEQIKYNIAIDLYKPLSRTTYAHVNSGAFSSYIYKHSHNLNTKEYLIKLFLEEYDLNTLSREDVMTLLSIDIATDGSLQYKYGDANNDMIADKILIVYFEDLEYVNHEIVMNTET